MMRRLAFRILLSTLLLLTQQLGVLHSLDHLAAAQDPAIAMLAASADAGDGSDSAVKRAHDRACLHCFSLAQLAAPLHHRGPTVLVQEGQAAQVALHGAVSAAAPSSYALFQSRAPPLA